MKKKEKLIDATGSSTIMDLPKARKILGDNSEKYSDNELQIIIEGLIVLSKICCSIINKQNETGAKLCQTQ